MAVSKAYLIKNRINKKGLAPIAVRYSYDGKSSAFSTGLSIEPSKFDDDAGLVKSAFAESKDLNPKIRRMIFELDELSTTLPNPTYQRLKEAYALQQQTQKEAELIENEQQKLKRRGAVAADLYNSFDAEDTENEIIKAQQHLEELLAKKAAHQKKGYKVNTFEVYEFKRLLSAYPTSKLNVTKRTKSQLETWVKIFEEFHEQHYHTITFESFDQQLYNDYATFLVSDKDTGGKDYFNNTAGKHIKNLKAFLSWSKIHHNKIVNPHYEKYQVLKEDKEIVYLTEQELNLLWEFQYNAEKVSKDQIKHIHLCVFQNLTGLRYSDLKRSLWKIEVVDGEEVLTGKTKKTKGQYQIPLLLDPRIKQILEIYNYRLDLVSEQKHNDNIKSICKSLFDHHKINKAPIRLIRYKLAEEIFDDKFKWELLTSHSARRGFATRLHHEGVGERNILLIMGSKSNEVLKKYIRNNAADMLRAVKMKRRNGKLDDVLRVA
jgi:integrase